MAQKTLALGTKLLVESDTPGSFLTVGHLTSIGVPGPTKGQTEVTDFDSVAREFLATLPDNGELPLAGFFVSDDTGQVLLYADANDPNAGERNFVIQFTRQAVEFPFVGVVLSFVPNAGGVDEAYVFSGSIRVTGAVVMQDIS